MNNQETPTRRSVNPVIPSDSQIIIAPSNKIKRIAPAPRNQRGQAQRDSRQRKFSKEISRQDTVSSSMPRNEQSLLQEVVDTERERSARDYLHCLVRPDECAARIPDSFSGDTALVSSVTVLQIPVFFTGMGTDSGRFSCMVNPTLGSLNEPSTFKVALVKPVSLGGGNYQWPKDLSLSQNFVSIDNGKDIRLDTFYSELTQPGMGVAYYNGDLPSATAGSPFGASITQQSGYGLTVQYNGSGQSAFSPPPGFYKVDIVLRDSTPTASLFPTVTPFGGATVITEYTGQSIDFSVSYFSAYITIPSANLGGTAGFTVAVPAGASFPLTQSHMSISRTFNDLPGIPESQGLVNKYRPVACSVLTTYTGPTLLDGGNIAGAFLPAGAVRSQFFNTNFNSAIGNLSSWENVAGVKGSFTCPLVKGNYSWYQPTALSDYDMFTPAEANAHDYPSIIVSGQVVPGNTAPVDGSTYVRVLIHSVYEIETDSLLLVSRHQRGSQAEMDRVLNHLVGLPHTMENPTHVSFGQKVLNAFKSAGSWIWKNRRPITSAIGSLGALML